MTSYDTRRLDGDPTYAPGITKAKGLFYWKPSRAMVAAGYAKQLYRLPGRDGDDLHLDRAARCRELTREMLLWASGNDTPKVIPGTWQWLIARYKTDEFSPFREVKANTRQNYRFVLARLEAAMGSTLVSDTTQPVLKKMERAMQERGRSVHYIKQLFTILRIVVGYGVQIEAPGAVKVRDILSEMKVRSPQAKSISPTQDQVFAVIQKADEAGDHPFALGIALQWWLTLRAVDVRGQYLEGRWADGLTWDMIAKDMSTIRKTISKTVRSAPEEVTFDISPITDIVRRLEAVPMDQRVGPVIKAATGRPYDKRAWSKLWRKHADAAGLPEELKAMDTRSGALNHGRGLGLDPFTLRNQAGHASVTTTDRYLRERNESINKVIQLRAGK